MNGCGSEGVQHGRTGCRHLYQVFPQRVHHLLAAPHEPHVKEPGMELDVFAGVSPAREDVLPVKEAAHIDNTEAAGLHTQPAAERKGLLKPGDEALEIFLGLLYPADIFTGIVPLNFITLSIYRSLEILSALAFYFGFILPKWVKKIFLKEE